MNTSSIVKVNLGSGLVGLPDWLNYDNSWLALAGRHRWLIRLLVACGLVPAAYRDVVWPPILWHDCCKGIPLGDRSVDYVYCSHFLEHLYRHEVVQLLKECARVLKPGGMIRVVVPDLDRLIEMYLRKDPKAFPAFPDPDNITPTYADLFMAHIFPYVMNLGKPPKTVERIQECFMRRHKWMYNADSLGRLLDFVGFMAIESKGYQESTMPDVAWLDRHPEVSCYVEAKKP